MADPFIGEIRIGGWNFAPVDWAICDGSLVSISDNSTLFNLIGTTFGGNGTTNFNLPNLLGRIPVHQGMGRDGSNWILGQIGGTETVTLSMNQIPSHSHQMNAKAGAGNRQSPAGGFWAGSSLEQFSTSAPSASMAPGALAQSGGDQPHDNMPPFLGLTFVIALFGIYPSQS